MRDYTNGPAPGFWRLWWKMGGGVSVVHLLICGASLLSFSLLQRQDTLLETRSQVVRSEVVDRRVDHAAQSDPRGSDNLYRVVFRFDVNEKTFTVEERMTAWESRKFRVGTRHELLVSRDAPDTIFPLSEQKSTQVQWLFLIGVLWGAGGLVGLFGALRQAYSARLAHLKGKVEKVHVLDTTDDDGPYKIN
ncbi:MAG: DUF3592 domain-containing protein [Pseudomonadota bacterium]